LPTFGLIIKQPGKKEAVRPRTYGADNLNNQI
jgi:hypothetical protein